MTAAPAITHDAGPIGIFDSGIGGLSILRHMRTAMPAENLIYFADSGFAPYGEKSEAAIAERSLAITDFLLAQGIKLLVVACNSATASSIQILRARHPGFPIIGVEPGLKPSSVSTKLGVVGVLATAATLSSTKFNALLASIAEQSNVRFILQPCNGLADQIERGEVHSPMTIRLLQQYVEPMLVENADTIVLGCTHYPFVKQVLENIIVRRTDRHINIIDTGEPVTRQTARRLEESGRANRHGAQGDLRVFTTGSVTSIKDAFKKLLQISVDVHPVTSS
jgi:glutamate racemase